MIDSIPQATSLLRRRRISSVLTWSRRTEFLRIAAVLTFCIAAIGARYCVAETTDDFDDGNDVGWTRYDPIGQIIGGSFATFEFPSGGYQIASDQSPNLAWGPARAASYRGDLPSADFRIATDVVDWDNSSPQLFGLFARSGDYGPGTTDGYAFLYEPVTGDIDLLLIDGESATTLIYENVDPLDPNQDYRFTFTGVGSHLKGEVFNLADLSTPLPGYTVEWDDSTYASGFSGLLVASVEDYATLNVTFDNFKAAASSIIWDNNGGNGNYNWAVAANWDPDQLPDEATFATISNTDMVILDQSGANAVKLTVTNGGLDIQATGDLTVTDWVDIAAAGTLNVAGMLTTKTTDITGGTVDVAANGWLMATQEVTVGAAGTLNLDGTLLADSLTLDGNLAGSGMIQINAERQVTLSGTATLARSTGSGTLLIGSDLVFAENAVYECELGGTAENDLLDVTGNVDLDPASVLKFKVNGGDLFKAGTYTLITSSQQDGISGAFDVPAALGQYATTGPDGNGLTYTSEPAALTLTIDKDLNPGDADLSTSTDLSDFNIWNANKFTTGTNWIIGDFNGDGTTDLSDFNVWNAHKFTTASGGAAPAPTQVPEPSTLALLCFALLAATLRLRKPTSCKS